MTPSCQCIFFSQRTPEALFYVACLYKHVVVLALDPLPRSPFAAVPAHRPGKGSVAPVEDDEMMAILRMQLW